MTDEVSWVAKLRPASWRQLFFSILTVVLFVVLTLLVYQAHTLPSASDNIYSAIKTPAAAFTVARTYTSKSNVMVNNLWRATTQLSGGGYHDCALSNGSFYCWGRGAEGQLANGTNVSKSLTPVAGVGTIFNTQRMTNISGGQYHACALNSGLVACWGNNTYGQLGTSNTTSYNQPTQTSIFGGGVTAQQISAGARSTCAISENKAACWGDNSKGQVGDNSTTTRTAPVYVKANASTDRLYQKSVTQIQVGGLFACGIANGAVYCWGENTYGQLGNNTTSTGATSAPVAVKVTVSTDALYGKTVTQIALGYNHACAIADGKAYCWGLNDSGQLGNGNTGTNSSVPVQVNGLLSGKTVTGLLNGGYKHMCAIADGKAYCWGLNDYGQLGNNSTTNSNVPVLVSSAGVLSGKTVTQLVGGDKYTCAIANGRAYCWGDNTYGQLGTNDSTQTSAKIPYRVNDSYY